MSYLAFALNAGCGVNALSGLRFPLFQQITLK
ncbi:hypothetical protein EcE24377A_2518 [Escherichia coli O139:H28 str. E24377A]|uniref:Uncharacterized protein n=1 Tax=Escherichia coli O139:H28 (strain E24377A / ETEC) TaxID=331111 RepID=A7ZP41_ECO24|nr:hypothetical protein EcE24377A_2518 [Escherichia coli O139:H28 str. E24377A]